jgi:uncharacterized C2H2 Zn-finger protein
MTEQLTHWKKLTNPDYLGSYAFQPGEEKTLTVREVKRETVTGPDGKKEDCSVLYWEEPEKPLVLNVTNAKTITRLAESPYIEKWEGLRVLLGVETVSAFGERVEAVRVKKRKPEQTLGCSECGQVITASGKFTAAQITQATTAKYGRPLCTDCARAEKEAQNGTN